MAGLAAAVIAVLLIGVLVVANPLNRGRSSGPPVNPTPTSTPAASPAASPSPSATASPTPDTTLPPFVCGTATQFTGSQPPLSANIDDVRTGSHAGYDRLTIQFNNGNPASTAVTPQSGTAFTQGGSGQSVTLLGQSGILVSINTADAHTAYSGPTDFKTGYPVMVEVRQVEDFEGHVRYGIGLSNNACYRAFYLANPVRLVIDVQAG
jgi:hypothetical protein